MGYIQGLEPQFSAQNYGRPPYQDPAAVQRIIVLVLAARVCGLQPLVDGRVEDPDDLTVGVDGVGNQGHALQLLGEPLQDGGFSVPRRPVQESGFARVQGPRQCIRNLSGQDESVQDLFDVAFGGRLLHALPLDNLAVPFGRDRSGPRVSGPLQRFARSLAAPIGQAVTVVSRV